jgi:hypothetical protein
MVTSRPRGGRRENANVVLLSLTPDGQLRDEAVIPRLLEAGRGATDCFVFCHGWPHDDGEARAEAARFFALLDQGLVRLRDRVVPLRVALRWPAPPMSERRETSLAENAAGLVPAGLSGALARQLLAAEVPEGPEDEAELELLRRHVRAEDATATLSEVAGGRLALWLMKRRAGQVGARFGREYLSVLTGCVRTHLIGHAYGGKLAAAAVLAGARPESLTLLRATFSAYAFAPAVPKGRGPGVYHALVTQRRVARPIIVLRADHDRAPAGRCERDASGGTLARRIALGRGDRTRTVVASSLIGTVGARGVGAPELTLAEVERVGLPHYPVVNVDGSAMITAAAADGGTHGDICHPGIATLILLAGGLLQVGPDGIRPPRLDPLSAA